MTRTARAGQAMVEYGVILALVSVVVVVILITQGAQLQNLFSNVTCSFSQAGCQVQEQDHDHHGHGGQSQSQG